MRELDEIQEEEELIHQAMIDSYLVLTEKISFEYLLAKRERQGKEPALLFDGFYLDDDGYVDLVTIDNMIGYFVELEDYEKCEELVGVKNRIKNEKKEMKRKIKNKKKKIKVRKKKK